MKGSRETRERRCTETVRWSERVERNSHHRLLTAG